MDRFGAAWKKISFKKRNPPFRRVEFDAES